MKLYEVYINNGWEYVDEAHDTILIVARDEVEANIRAESLLLDTYYEGKYNKPYYHIEEITKVDGFRIAVIK